MPTLGVPPHHRALSRIGFYLGVALILWAMGRLEQPGAALPQGWSDEELGVSPVYIASPVMPRYATLPQGR